MNLYFAPMEGLTDAFFRKTHARFYPGLTKYYTPFFSPTVHRSLTSREERELPVADPNVPVVPQLLTKNPEDFLWMAERCAERGYREVNLNVGCPSGTVFSKGKGSGMLSDPDALDSFLNAIFASAPLPISVKTRIGVADPEEFPRILEIFSGYPICELTVHPRVRKEFYNGSVHMDSFRYAYNRTNLPLCYNGDLHSVADLKKLEEAYPDLPAAMIGRALIGNPGLMANNTDIRTLQAFETTLLEGYLDLFGSARNTLFRMKEHWNYLIPNFPDAGKLAKQLQKTKDLSEFRDTTIQIFNSVPFRP